MRASDVTGSWRCNLWRCPGHAFLGLFILVTDLGSKDIFKRAEQQKKEIVI